MKTRRHNGGFLLVSLAVLMVAIVGITLAASSVSALSKAVIVRQQLALEQARYLAEAGAEIGVAHVAAAGSTPARMSDALGRGRYTVSVSLTNILGQADASYVIRSEGQVGRISRLVILEGARHKTWAKYALWSRDNRQIYFKSGEVFDGPVHANNELWFSGNPEFLAAVTSSASTYGGRTNDCIFHQGFRLGVPTDSMADVDFASLKSAAALVLSGTTSLRFEGTNMVVSNDDNGWTNRRLPVPQSGAVYVQTSGRHAGTVEVQGVLDGRLTVVADHDIRITDNLTYATDPAGGRSSDDALGLIAGRNIAVERSFPNNGKIYAHMMATGKETPRNLTDGSFGVVDYDERRASGNLTVYGGIVQDYRGAVGTFSGSRLVSGFDKHYTYDPRFASYPPPCYPPLSDEFTWDRWREGGASCR